jgi:hypothetical protein
MIKKLKHVILFLILIHSTISAQYNFEVAFPNLTFSSALDLTEFWRWNKSNICIEQME